MLATGLLGCGSEVGDDGQTGAGGSTTTSGPGATNGVGSGPSTGCEGTPVKAADGTDSGFVRCSDGTVHRPTSVTCDATIEATACVGDETTLNCTTDADCAAGGAGKCASLTGVDFGGTTTYCGCVYACATDDDCEAGAVCVCAGVLEGATWSACIPGGCAKDADCPSGECSLSTFDDGCETNTLLACRSAEDQCASDADCPETTPSCVVLSGTTFFQCSGPNCAIGRPFVVDGAALTAEAAERDAWVESCELDAAALEPALRERLAAHWLAVAALEHASIASFARFGLELLSLGAPPALVEGAHRAALDEIRHARVAYAVASRYRAATFGPGPLAPERVAPRIELEAFVAALVEEACVGETVGVAEALYLADRAQDGELRAIHRAVARDEQRHAELAWATLAWIVRRSGAPAREAARRAFARATAELLATPQIPGTPAPEVGLLSAAELGAVRRRAVESIVAPCAAALLGPPPERAADAHGARV